MQWITFLAILTGPVLAILVSRYLDQRRENWERRMNVFRTLMRTRRTPISDDHVGALNLVEIEFANDRDVIKALKELFTHLGSSTARRPAELVEDSMDAEAAYSRNIMYENRIHSERQSLLAKLLHSIAKNLGFKIEQLEIFEGGYSPQARHDLENEQRFLRKYLIGMAQGDQVLPVSIIDAEDDHPDE